MFGIIFIKCYCTFIHNIFLNLNCIFLHKSLINYYYIFRNYLKQEKHKNIFPNKDAKYMSEKYIK
jgi:hypothetical protein